MAGNQFAGDGMPSNLAGMSKSQLYDVMSQIKTLIDQNHQQARDILIQNPLLTKALFQAQIMLGMVKPPQMVPNIPPASSQHTQQSGLSIPQTNIQASPSLQAQIGLQEPAGATQTPIPVRKQQPNPVLLVSAPSADPLSNQSQSLPLHPSSIQQPKEHFNAQPTPISIPQPSQTSNIPPLPHHVASQPSSVYQPPTHTPSIQMHTVPTSGYSHLPLQPPLPPQPRPPSMQAFPHQVHPQMGPNAGFQHSGTPQMHPSQPLFHPGVKPPHGLGPAFPQGQMPLPNQSLSQQLYQGKGSHLGTEFNQVGSSMQVDRGPAWMPGVDNAGGSQLSGPPQMSAGNQPPRAPSLTPEMEKALLQQVMSLTPDQINLLPSEQRNQVLQLQQMLRQ